MALQGRWALGVRPAGEVHLDRLRPRPPVRHLHHADGSAAAAGGAAGAGQRAGRARPGDVPGPPLPAGVPRCVDAAVVCRRAHLANPPLRQRHQPAAAPTRRARARGGEPGPAERRPRRPRTRGGCLLGRHRGHGRTAAGAGGVGRGARGGHRGHPHPVGHADPRSRQGGGPAPPRGRGQARTGTRARHPDLGRRPQAAHAEAGRPPRRRLAAEPGLRRGRRGDRPGQRRHRRERPGCGPRSGCREAAAQHRPWRRQPGLPHRAGAGARRLRFHPRQRRPARHRALRAGGGPGGSRARRGRASRGRAAAHRRVSRAGEGHRAGDGPEPATAPRR